MIFLALAAFLVLMYELIHLASGELEHSFVGRVALSARRLYRWAVR